MQADNRPLKTTWPRFLAAAGVFLVVALLLLMPDVTRDLDGARLVLFWVIHVFGGLAILQAAHLGLSRLAPFRRSPALAQVIICGVVGTFLFTPMAILTDIAFGLDPPPAPTPRAILRLWTDEFLGLAGIFTVVWIGLNAALVFRVASPDPQARDLPAFWSRVPAALGTRIVALSAELHYTRVHTRKGDALILFPFGQAIAQLDGVVPGVQIHRSHWVASAEIEARKRRGKTGSVVLSTGLELPVSRRRRDALERHLAARR